MSENEVNGAEDVESDEPVVKKSRTEAKVEIEEEDKETAEVNDDLENTDKDTEEVDDDEKESGSEEEESKDVEPKGDTKEDETVDSEEDEKDSVEKSDQQLKIEALKAKVHEEKDASAEEAKTEAVA
ncbi:hypothetical protein Ciccas_003586 [Cichlidogyrus casuarinus]|uniref:Uncharacterized protein n=1 Tax=Cichlidogyrus casuarinus TaxID=1844966 RepID=A0ABD2QEE4_9PLAT